MTHRGSSPRTGHGTGHCLGPAVDCEAGADVPISDPDKLAKPADGNALDAHFQPPSSTCRTLLPAVRSDGSYDLGHCCGGIAAGALLRQLRKISPQTPIIPLFPSAGDPFRAQSSSSVFASCKAADGWQGRCIVQRSLPSAIEAAWMRYICVVV